MQRTTPLLALIFLACGNSPDDGSSSSGGSASTGGGGHTAGGSTGTGGSSSAGGNGTGGGGSANGGTAGNATGGLATGGGGGNTDSGGSDSSGGSGTVSVCDDPVGPGLPEGAPELEVGVWKEINNGLGFDVGPDDLGSSSIAVDPCNPAVLYVSTGAFDTAYGGFFKSIDAGAHWTRVGNTPNNTGGGDHLDLPLGIRVDPEDTQHLYLVDGVRGSTSGFWVSTDGGETFAMPQGFKDAGDAAGAFVYDGYFLDVDPTDFQHVLVTFHGAWGWTDTKWNTNSGVFESTDGGASWIVHEPVNGWGTGHAVNFLYKPELGLGDANTWLLGTQGNGMWRTTNAGASWDKVTDNNIAHGGGAVYYASDGKLYATGGANNMRSTDNGATWTAVGPGGSYNGIGGDGRHIFIAKGGPFIVSDDNDGLTWTNYSEQSLATGTYEIRYDATNDILYASMWNGGVWALKPE